MDMDLLQDLAKISLVLGQLCFGLYLADIRRYTAISGDIHGQVKTVSGQMQAVSGQLRDKSDQVPAVPVT